MYKRLIILAAILALFHFGQVAYAGFGVHQALSKNSDICTTCHRQHDVVLSQGADEANYVTSQQTSEYEFCSTCHGPEAAGADTDIVNGVYDNASSTYGTYGTTLNSGGFDKLGGVTGGSTTSTHSVDGTNYPIFGSSTGGSVALTCTSCHDPDGSSNYRMLKDEVNGKNVASYVESNEPGFEDSLSGHEQISGNYVPNYTSPNYKTPADLARGIAGWCAACHDNYKSETYEVDPKNSRKHYYYTDSEGKRRYRHAVNVPIGNNPSGNTVTDLPLAKASAGTSDSDSSNLVICLTCHRAHGTDATMTEAATVEPTKSTSSSGPGYSALLRFDNRGVCQNCHKRL